MDPIEMLIDGAIQHEVLLNKNPYLTMETMILRLYKKIFEHTRVSYSQFDKTILFSQWHFEILDAYESIKSNMSHEEKGTVERVLSKDCPHPSELTKFACSWYKHDPIRVCRWFAVDGIIGTHPKVYVQDAFSTNFEKHNSAVRVLYSYYTNPENIKQIVGKALDIQEDEVCPLDSDPDFNTCVGLYAEMVGKEEMKRVASDRQAKLQAQQQPSKRKKKNRPQSPQTASPPDSPLNLDHSADKISKEEVERVDKQHKLPVKQSGKRKKENRPQSPQLFFPPDLPKNLNLYSKIADEEEMEWVKRKRENSPQPISPPYSP